LIVDRRIRIHTSALTNGSIPDPVSGSGMEKNPEPGSGNRDEHPGSVFRVKILNFFDVKARSEAGFESGAGS
jgi:hypothetical protein